LEELIFAKSQLTQNEVEQIFNGEPESRVKKYSSLQEEKPIAPQSKNDDKVSEEPREEPIQEELYIMPEGLTPELQTYFKQLDLMTVHELRRFARTVEGLPIYGRQISRANKKELVEELLKTKKV